MTGPKAACVAGGRVCRGGLACATFDDWTDGGKRQAQAALVPGVGHYPSDIAARNLHGFGRSRYRIMSKAC